MSRKRLNRAELARHLETDSSAMDSEDPRAFRSPKTARVSRQTDKASREPPPEMPMLHWSDPLPVTRQEPGGVPLRIWTSAMEVSAWKQLSQVATLPFIHPRGVAVMPDVHVGSGACVGSVLPLRGALVPQLIGVDIGCGMAAVRLDLSARDLPDTLRAVRQAIEEAVPVGMASHREVSAPEVWAPLCARYRLLLQKSPRMFKRHAGEQLGTLGGGNHFIEVCLDEAQQVWVMLHSGSRGVGGQIGQHYIAQALRWCEGEGLKTPGGLGYLLEGTPLFEDYWNALLWAQEYAQANREVMMKLTLKAVSGALGRPLRVTGEAVRCHHNYVAREQHFGEELLVTRKGAIRAGAGEWGIIPGSMGTESFIVRGKGNVDSYCSCSHGAGRAMSRAAARQQFSTKDVRRQTEGVECKKDSSVIDEAPGAYKPIRAVMTQQQDLVEVVHTLRQVVCVKG